jgi:hypothetical protein
VTTDSTINTETVFDDESAYPDFPEVAYDLVEEMSGEALIAAVGFSSLLWEILTDEQKGQLSDWDRAALQRLSDLSDDTGLEVVGKDLRKLL